MNKNIDLDGGKTYSERIKSIKETLLSIKFPEKLIDDEIYNIMIKIQFEEIKIKNNQESFFRNYTKNNTANGKFRYNLLNENSDFNIKPLFEKYHYSLKKEKISLNYLKKELLSKTKIYSILLHLKYLIINESFYSDETVGYFFHFSLDCFEQSRKKLENKSYYIKGMYNLFDSFNNFNILENYSISTEEFKKLIFSYFNDYKKIFKEDIYKNKEKIAKKNFVISPEIVSFDSIELLYFTTLKQLYHLFFKNNLDINKFDTLINSFLNKKSNFNINYSSKEELIHKFFYFYQSYKNYNNFSLFDFLIEDKTLNFYNRNFKKDFIYPYRKKETKLLSKNEFMDILNEKDESNFSKNIKKYKKFIDNFFTSSDKKLSIEKDLELFSLYYQELFHNEDGNTVTIRNRFKNNKNICQSDYEFINRKLERIKFITDFSVEKYKKYISFLKNIRKIYINNLYDEDSTILLELIEKSLTLYLEQKYKNVNNINLKKVIIFLDNNSLNPNFYSTKFTKK